MLEIDGSCYSGSGTIVRQAVAFSALTGTPVRIFNIRVKRPKPGLRRQHLQVVESIRQLVNGTCDSLTLGAQELTFRPGNPSDERRYVWDVGSAGSTVALAIAVLPLLALRAVPTAAELRGGLFQDFAPSFYHFERVLLPLVGRMGVRASARMERPGYVPAGGGILHLMVEPTGGPLKPLVLEHQGAVARVGGVAISSRLKSQAVSSRMAQAARQVLEAAGYHAEIEEVYDESALQAGAGLALVAELSGGALIGADRAGAPGRRSEAIGSYAARQLLEDLQSGATLDRYAADQIIPFAALAAGESRFLIPTRTDHVESNAWLSREFLGSEVRATVRELIVKGVGFRPKGRGGPDLA